MDSITLHFINSIAYNQTGLVAERAAQQNLQRQKTKNSHRSYHPFPTKSEIKINLPLSAVKEYRGFSGMLRVPGSLNLECGDRDDGAGSKRFEFACNRKTNQKVKCNFLGDLLMQ